MNIADNLRLIQNSLPKQLRLVAVSKTKPTSDILEAYTEGQRIFGENKALELAEKAEKLPTNIQWHMIGHLQRNKVKYIAPFVSLMHGVDSLKLLKEINKRAAQNNRVIDCLLQVRIARESMTLYGYYLAMGLMLFIVFQALINIGVVIGLMPITGIPLTFTSFGGTSLVTSLFYVGVILNVSRETCLKEHEFIVKREGHT